MKKKEEKKESDRMMNNKELKKSWYMNFLNKKIIEREKEIFYLSYMLNNNKEEYDYLIKIHSSALDNPNTKRLENIINKKYSDDFKKYEKENPFSRMIEIDKHVAETMKKYNMKKIKIKKG